MSLLSRLASSACVVPAHWVSMWCCRLVPVCLGLGLLAGCRVYDGLIEGVINEGIQAGRLAPLPAKLVSFAILGMCNWLYQWYQPDGPLSADEVARNFIQLVEQGYLHADPQQEILQRLDRVESALSALQQNKELFFTGTITVEGDARDAQPLGDGFERRCPVTLLPKAVRRRLQDGFFTHSLLASPFPSVLRGHALRLLDSSRSCKPPPVI